MRNKRVFPVRVITDPVEALQAAVYGRTALDACAQAVGVSNQTLSKQLNEVDGLHLSLRRAVAIDRFLGEATLARSFAAASGGVFVPLPERGIPARSLTYGWAKLVSEFAQASQAYAEALADERMTPEEVDRFEAELRDVTVEGMALVQAARAALQARAG